MEMNSMYFTWFPIRGFRRTQTIPSIGLIYKKVGILMAGVLLWRISGGYSQEVNGVDGGDFTWMVGNIDLNIE